MSFQPRVSHARVARQVAAVNASLAACLSPQLRSHHGLVSFIGVIALCVATVGYGGWRLSQTFATGDPLEIAVVQGAIERQVRWNPAYRQSNLDRYLTLTKATAPTSPRLIFWPEYAVDFPLQDEVPEREVILGASRNLRVDFILGGPHYSYGTSAIDHHNSVFLIRKGKLAGRYDKIRLLPFAESNQLSEIFPAHENYKPGRHPTMLRADGVQIGAFVCFEAMYPDLVRRFALQGAEVFANPSNDDWFGSAAPARHQLDIAAVRAIENRRYLVRPTATGFSAVIDPHGRIRALSDFGVPQTLTASIRPSRVQTSYQQWGDVASWLAAGSRVFSREPRLQSALDLLLWRTACADLCLDRRLLSLFARGVPL